MLLYTYKLQNRINITKINTWKFKDDCDLLYCCGLELNLQYLHGMPVLEQPATRTLITINVWELYKDRSFYSLLVGIQNGIHSLETIWSFVTKLEYSYRKIQKSHS